MRKALVLGFALFSFLAHAEISISITGANVKKAKLAIGKVHPLPGTSGVDPKLTRDIEQQVQYDLEFTNLFELMPEGSFNDLDQPGDLYKMAYESWAPKAASFVLKMGHKVESGKLTLEAILYDVPGQKKVFGTRYQYPAAQYSRLVHALTEDILKALTGERGLFFSRIAMVCRESNSRKGDVKEVAIVDPDGRGFTQLTTDRTLSLSPAWASDGKSVLYTQYGSVRGSRKRGTLLKRHNLQTGDRKIISSREGMNSGAAWSPKDSRIALTLSFNGRPEIYLLNSSGQGQPEPLSRMLKLKRIGGEGFQPSYASLLFDVEPSWSPDAQKIVFSSARSGSPMIYVMDVASKVATQLTFAGKYNATPDWSPKGDKILFAAQRIAEGNFDLYIIDPDGNNLNRITNGDRAGGKKVNSENPSWSPTGRHFAYSSNEGGSYAVYVMSVDGSVKKKISPDNRECTEPTWGPFEG